MKRIVLLLCALAGTAVAKPPALEPHDMGAFSIGLPAGWNVGGDAAKGVVIAQQEPGRKDAAQILFVVSQNASASEDQVLDALAGQAIQGLTVVRRGAGPGGAGKMLVADGAAGDVKVRLGALAVGGNGGMMVCLFVAKPADFDALGGVDLAGAVLLSLKASAPKEQYMEPQYGPANNLLVPPPTRQLTIADLVGEWHRDDAAVSNYVSISTGQYAGFNSIQISETWNIDARGQMKMKFVAGRAGLQGPSGVKDDSTGDVVVEKTGALFIHDKGHGAARYIVRGWFYGKDVTVMRLHGPLYGEKDTIPPAEFADPNYNLYLNHDYIRRNH